jgi:hypothetical protein
MNRWQKMDVQTDRVNSPLGFVVFVLVMLLGAWMIH